MCKGCGDKTVKKKKERIKNASMTFYCCLKCKQTEEEKKNDMDGGDANRTKAETTTKS